MPNQYPYIVKSTQTVTEVHTTYYVVQATSDEDAETKCFAGDYDHIVHGPTEVTEFAFPAKFETLPSDDPAWDNIPELSDVSSELS